MAIASIEPATLSVEPGREATCTIRVRNDGSIVDRFSFELVGAAAGWASFEPESVSLFPGVEGTATLTFRPPRESTTVPGPLPFGVKIIPKETLDGTHVEEGRLDVASFAESFAELVPRTARGRIAAKQELALDNRGNARVNASLTASDPDDVLRFNLAPPGLVAEPGTASFTRLRVRPKKRFLRGAPKSHSFRVLVQPELGEELSVDGTMVQEALIPRWAPIALLALAALVAAWFALIKPEISSQAKKAAEEVLGAQLVGAPQSGGGNPSGGSPPTSPPTAPPTTAPAPVNAPFDRRLGVTTCQPTGSGCTATYQVPANRVVSLTDLVLQNPKGDFGRIRIRRGGGLLLEVALQNFRDLDYHFVAPIVLGPGSKLTVEVTCEDSTDPSRGTPVPPCTPAVYFSGFVRST